MKARVHRNTLKATEVQVDATPAGGKHRCKECGVTLSDRLQPVCSFCAGDPRYGRDGYYLDILRDWLSGETWEFANGVDAHRAEYFNSLIRRAEPL